MPLEPPPKLTIKNEKDRLVAVYLLLKYACNGAGSGVDFTPDCTSSYWQVACPDKLPLWVDIDTVSTSDSLKSGASLKATSKSTSPVVRLLGSDTGASKVVSI